MGLGACMYYQLICTGSLNGLRTIFSTQVVVKTQTHFGRDRHMGRHSTTHRRHNLTYQLGFVQQHSAPAMPIDSFGRAAKVEINACRVELGQAGCVGSQDFRLRAQQLRSDGHTRVSFAFIQQLWHHPVKGSFWKHRIGHADEFRHAQINAAHTRERVSQAVVQQPFHGSEQNFHSGPGFMSTNASFELLQP